MLQEELKNEAIFTFSKTKKKGVCGTGIESNKKLI
jgi:hypothetical protein